MWGKRAMCDLGNGCKALAAVHPALLNAVCCITNYDPRPTPSLLRVGMKLSDPDLLKTAEPLIYILLLAAQHVRQYIYY
jgi:hypothetical protein